MPAPQTFSVCSDRLRPDAQPAYGEDLVQVVALARAMPEQRAAWEPGA